MHYDPESRKVIVSAYVDPKWLNSAKLDDLRTHLVYQGINHFVQGLGLAEAEAGEVLAAANAGKDCSVNFFTLTIQADNLTRKEVATEEGGKLILK